MKNCGPHIFFSTTVLLGFSKLLGINIGASCYNSFKTLLHLYICLSFMMGRPNEKDNQLFICSSILLAWTYYPTFPIFLLCIGAYVTFLLITFKFICIFVLVLNLHIIITMYSFLFYGIHVIFSSKYLFDLRIRNFRRDLR